MYLWFTGMTLGRNGCEGREDCQGAKWEKVEWARLVMEKRY